MRSKLSLSMTAALLALSLTPIGVRAKGSGDSRGLGNSAVVAPVPLPGYPEGIATHSNRFYVAGPAAFGQPLGSAFVHAYDIDTGALEATYLITVTNPSSGMSGGSCAAFGPSCARGKSAQSRA